MTLSAHDFQSLLSALAPSGRPAGQSDARRSSRVPQGIGATVTLVRPAMEETLLRVTIHDVSPTGIAVVSAKATTPGDTLTVYWLDADGPHHLLARVVHCKPDARGQFRTGAEFVATGMAEAA